MSSINWDELLMSHSQGESNTPTSGIPLPSGDEMEKRWAFRRSIDEQTLQHRRTHPNDKARNILWALADREIRGPQQCILRVPTKRKRNAVDTAASKARRIENGAFTVAPPSSSPKSVNEEDEQLYLPLLPSAYPTSVFGEIQHFAEYYSVTRYQSAFLHHLGGQDVVDEDGERPASSAAVSTISIAFSPDKQTMASTHGDHTVKITGCSTGGLLQTLEGHPRTPWTVKFHPIDSSIVASGCLGFQVRLWNWEEGQCLHMIRLDYAIISLSFHSSGHILAVASGTRLHFWDYGNHGGRTDENGKKAANGALTEVEQRHMLRCVHFPPGGKSVIVGGMNHNDDRNLNARSRGGMSGGGISFYLRMWEFNLDAALHPEQIDGRVIRKPMSNPRTVVPRALLYNDGGFDVSPDGRMLCACAEYWLPDGVNNAMELLQQEQRRFRDEHDADGSDASGMERSKSASNLSTDEALEQPALLMCKSEGLGSTPPRAPVGGTSTSFASPPREHSRPLLNAPPPPRQPPPQRSPGETVPLTPPNRARAQLPLSPPSPPGRRWTGAVGQPPAAAGGRSGIAFLDASGNEDRSASLIPPPPGPSGNSSFNVPSRPPHPLSVITGGTTFLDMTSRPGRFVPHVVCVSLDTSPIAPTCITPREHRGQMTSVAKGHEPRLGQLLEACPLDGAKASAVTCVKFSPSADFCLLGYGVREPLTLENGEESRFHPVTALYRVLGGMQHVSTMISADDDVNIARFHPDSGYGFVYGTKQGRVRVLGPRPWNFYNC